MMTTKERDRVKRYLNSDGIKAAWYYIVIALTMGNVNTAVEEYYDENDRLERNRVAIDSMVSSTSRPADIGGYSYEIHDTDDGAEVDLLTAAILAQRIDDSRTETTEYDVSGGEASWSGFGGGGDASGGGAGGDWSPSSAVETNTTPSYSDSYSSSSYSSDSSSSCDSGGGDGGGGGD